MKLKRLLIGSAAVLLIAVLAFSTFLQAKSEAAISNGNVIVADDTGLYKLNPNGTGNSDYTLMTYPSGNRPVAVSSDGKLVAMLGIAYHTLTLETVFGTGSTVVDTAPGNGNYIAYAKFSKDGKKLVYTKGSSTNSTSDVFIYDIASGDVTQLTSAATNQYYIVADIKADGSKVLATAQINDSTHLAVVSIGTDLDVNPGINTVVPVTSGNSTINFAMKYMPDGKILYSVPKTATETNTVSYSLRIATDANHGDNDYLTDTVVYAHTEGACIPAVNGGTCTVTANISDVAVSSDGSKIAFAVNRSGSGTSSPIYSQSHVSVVSGGTWGVPSDLNAASTIASTSFFFSPDGQRVVYSLPVSINSSNYSRAISVAADGSDSTSPVPYQPPWVNGSSQDNVIPIGWVANGPAVTDAGGGDLTSTVSESQDYSSVDWNVINGETLTLDGTLGNVNVYTGGILKGHGTAGNVSVDALAHLAPGNSPGCMTVSNLNFNAASVLDEEIGGTSACTGYDQITASGTVTINSLTSLNATAYNNFSAKAGDSFTIINNVGSNPVSGTFSGLAEGAELTINGVAYNISYAGGDGNDVVLTVPATNAAGQPNGSGSSNATAGTSAKAPGTPNTGMAMIAAHPATVLAATTLAAGSLLFIARRFTSK